MDARGRTARRCRSKTVRMRIDLSDLDRLEGFVEALGRLF